MYSDVRGKKDETKNGNNHEEMKENLDLTFENTELAYRSKTFADLIRGYFVFLLCSSKFIVEHNEKIIKVCEKILGRRLFAFIMKKTVYGHFVGGENTEKVKPKLALLRKYGVKSILDYSVEEDLSKEEAVEREMSSLVSEIKSEEVDEYTEELGGKMIQFKPAEEFADRREHVESARTYFYENENKCDRNADAFVECIKAIADEGDGFVAIKLTALGRPQLLLQLSEIIMRAREFSKKLTGQDGSVITQKLKIHELKKNLEKHGIVDMKKFMEHIEVDNDEVLHIFPWYGIINDNRELDESFRIPCMKEKRMVRLLKQLSKDEEQMFRNMIARLIRILCVAEENEVHLMIDAEQTYFQPAISRIAMELMHKYNRKKCTLFNTYQSYLKGSLQEILGDMELAKRQCFNFGCKLVRGAYLHQERERAETLGYEDPTNDSFESTTAMLYEILDEIFNRIIENKENANGEEIKVMIASHNEETNRFVIEKMINCHIKNDGNVIFLGQLLGMCDYVTFILGQAGFASYKYVPYGPVHDVLPYLSRRARENISVLEKIQKEKRMLKTEIKRRILKRQFFYKP